MGADVIQFPGKDDPHISGEAHCILCGNKWVSVAPIGVVWLECSKCGSMKGVYDFHCEPTGPIWECACGNSLFYVTQKGFCCPNCGEQQYGF